MSLNQPATGKPRIIDEEIAVGDAGRTGVIPVVSGNLLGQQVDVLSVEL